MNKKNKMLTIMLIPSILMPIPSVKGGGIETLITNMININENNQKIRFVIVSIFDEEAIKHKYKFTKIYYFLPNKLNCTSFHFLKLSYKTYTIYCYIKKIILNRFTRMILKNIPHVTIPNLFIYQCMKICKRENVDFVVNESCMMNMLSFRPLSDYIGCNRMYFRIHNLAPVGKKEERMIFPNSISLSYFERDNWTSSCNIKGDNTVVFNGIDIDSFSKEYEEKELSQLKKSLNIQNDDKVILYVGRISEIKGVSELIDAFNSICMNNIKLLIIGSVAYGKDITSNFYEAFLKKIKSPNIIYTRYIPNDKLPMYYKIADIQVVPSICPEGASLVCIEGMASGLPLIVTKSGGMVEYVNDKCAIILPIDEQLSKKIATNIEVLLNNEEKMEQMKKHSIQRAKKFTKEKNYKDFIRVFLNDNERQR